MHEMYAILGYFECKSLWNELKYFLFEYWVLNSIKTNGLIMLLHLFLLNCGEIYIQFAGPNLL